MSNKHKKTSYFAAIDLGSNSFHMLVASIQNDTITWLDREKTMVQIAKGIDSKGLLSEDAQERALNCLKRFSERLKNIPLKHIRAVGTKSMRVAKNAENFIQQAEKSLGVPIEIISGYEEARLVYVGVSNTLAEKNQQRLVIDIGGGSTEFIIGKAYNTFALESLSIGCVSFAKQHNLSAQNTNENTMLDAYTHAAKELLRISKNYVNMGWETVIGTSGTIKAIADITTHVDGGAIISKAALTDLYEKCSAGIQVSHSSLSDQRLSVIYSGIAILKAIVDILNIEIIEVCDATLKEGLIFDSLERNTSDDAREKSIEKLIKKHHVDRSQGIKVAQTTLKLWKEISHLFENSKIKGVSRTKILRWAALLHEIGLDISHNGYHHHGYYIVRNSDLEGFGRQEQYILATLIKNHRKKLTFSRFKDLNQQTVDAFIPLLVCLRLAVVIHRGRSSKQLPLSFSCQPSHGFEFDISILQKHIEQFPLTMSSIENEIVYFAELNTIIKKRITAHVI